MHPSGKFRKYILNIYVGTKYFRQDGNAPEPFWWAMSQLSLTYGWTLDRRPSRKKKKGSVGNASRPMWSWRSWQIITHVRRRWMPQKIRRCRKEVFSSFLHSCSTEKEPQHQACLQKEDSWCHHNHHASLEATGKPQPQSPACSREVAKELVPVYKHLPSQDLLERHAKMKIQNVNQSLNALVCFKNVVFEDGLRASKNGRNDRSTRSARVQLGL